MVTRPVSLKSTYLANCMWVSLYLSYGRLCLQVVCLLFTIVNDLLRLALTRVMKAVKILEDLIKLQNYLHRCQSFEANRMIISSIKTWYDCCFFCEAGVTEFMACKWYFLCSPGPIITGFFFCCHQWLLLGLNPSYKPSAFKPFCTKKTTLKTT